MLCFGGSGEFGSQSAGESVGLQKDGLRSRCAEDHSSRSRPSALTYFRQAAPFQPAGVRGYVYFSNTERVYIQAVREAVSACG